MVLTAYVGLSPVTGLFCHRRLADIVLSKPGWVDLNSANLTPASGRQDHTILPSAKSVSRQHAGDRSRVFRLALQSHRAQNAAASTATHPAFVTIMIRPSCGVGWREFVEMICPTGEAKYFCKGDWTQKCPTGKSDREVTTNRPAGASGQVAGVAEIGHSRGVPTERPNQETPQHACLPARFVRRAAPCL